MTLARVRTVLTGFPGGPGISTHYFLDSAGSVAAVAAFWAACVTQMPITVTAQVQPSGDIIDPANGAIVGSFNETGQPFSRGTSDISYAAPAGAVIRWNTNGVAAGKRIRGRTFIVPLFGGAYQSDGSLSPSCLNALTNAASGLAAALPLSFSIWHRPKFGPRPVAGGPRPLITAGTSSQVTSSSVPDKVAVLRSRRD